MPLECLGLTELASQVTASWTHGSHGTEGQSPCAAHSRDSTHTRPVRMCQQCSAFTYADADLSPPRVTTADEAHPARPPCAIVPHHLSGSGADRVCPAPLQTIKHFTSFSERLSLPGIVIRDKRLTSVLLKYKECNIYYLKYV